MLLPLGLYLLNPSPILDPDSSTYIQPGLQLWTNGAFGSYFPDGSFLPETNRTPFYPFLIGWLYYTGLDHLGAVFMQSLFHALAVVALLLLPCKSKRIKTIGAALMALHPLSLLYANKVLTESTSELTLAMVMASLVMSCASMKTERRSWQTYLLVLICGGFSSMACLCRPANAGLLLACPLTLAYCASKISWRLVVSSLLLFLLSLIPLFGWLARNAYYTGSPTLSTVGGDNLLFHGAGFIVSQQQNVPLDEIVKRMRLKDEALSKKLQETPWQSDTRRKHEAIEIISAHPFIYLKGLMIGSARLLGGIGAMHWEAFCHRYSVILSFLTAIHLAILYAFLLYCAWTNGGLRKFSSQAAIPLLLFLTAASLSIVSEGQSRFRVPLVPLLIGSAVMGWQSRKRN